MLIMFLDDEPMPSLFDDYYSEPGLTSEEKQRIEKGEISEVDVWKSKVRDFEYKYKHWRQLARGLKEENEHYKDWIDSILDLTRRCNNENY